MSLDSIRVSIETRFVNNWTDTPLTTGVRFSNSTFTPPEGSNWVSFDVRFAPSRNSLIGSNNVTTRRNGSIFVDFYAPIDEGTGSLTASIDNLLTIFENKQFDNIQCLAAVIRHIGVPNIQGTDPQWYMYSVRIPFYRYE